MVNVLHIYLTVILHLNMIRNASGNFFLLFNLWCWNTLSGNLVLHLTIRFPRYSTCTCFTNKNRSKYLRNSSSAISVTATDAEDVIGKSNVNSRWGGCVQFILIPLARAWIHFSPSSAVCKTAKKTGFSGLG